MEQMSGPGDASRNCWQVSHDWRVVLVLLILVLNLMDLKAVVVEQDGVLGVQSILQVVSVENGLELSQEFQRILDIGDYLKVLVNVVLELSFD